MAQATRVATLLGVSREAFVDALTSKTIFAHGETVGFAYLHFLFQYPYLQSFHILNLFHFLLL